MKTQFILLIILLNNNIISQTLKFKEKLFLPDSSNAYSFGKEIQIFENNSFIASSTNIFIRNGKIENNGGVYNIEKDKSDKWIIKQFIQSNDYNKSDQFGESIRVEKDFLYITAYEQDTDENNQDSINNSGAVYIFIKDSTNNWIQNQKIVPKNRFENLTFGSSIELKNNFLFIGARNQKNKIFNNESGLVYVFRKDENNIWIEYQILKASDQNGENNFGRSVSCDNNFLFVGTQFTKYSEKKKKYILNSSVYIFKLSKNGFWEETQILIPNEIDNYFGENIIVKNNCAIISARFSDFDTTNNNFIPTSGLVYIFKCDSIDKWILIQKITANDRGRLSEFGNSIKMYDSLLLIGAVGNQTDENSRHQETDTGAAYLFKLDNNGYWQQIKKIVAFDRNVCDKFGYKVEMDKKHVLITAISDDLDEYDNKGSVYYYELE